MRLAEKFPCPRGVLSATAPSPVAAPLSGASLHGAFVLVVDDDGLVREAIVGLLGQWGCEVASAANGDEALAILTRLPRVPDAIMCDYRLPREESGIDVIRSLRGRAGAEIPAALVTGDITPELLRRASDDGYALLHKPVQPAKLRALLEHLISPLSARRRAGG